MFGIRLNVGHKCSIPLKKSDTIRIQPNKINADLPDSDGSGSFHQQAKKVRKSKISIIFWILFNFLFFKTDVNVPSNSDKQKTLKKTFLLATFQPLMEEAGSGTGSGSLSQWYGSTTLVKKGKLLEVLE